MTYLALNGPPIAMDRVIRATRFVPEVLWYRRKDEDGTSAVRFYLNNGADRNQIYKAVNFWMGSSIFTRRELVEETEKK